MMCWSVGVGWLRALRAPSSLRDGANAILDRDLLAEERETLVSLPPPLCLLGGVCLFFLSAAATWMLVSPGESTERQRPTV